jgi:hypothetical protein
LGIVGRLAALFMIAFAALDMQAAGMVVSGNALLSSCGIIVVHFASGYCPLWRPEEPLLHRRLRQRQHALK